ncbi:MAG: hypothetical protein K8T89_18310 [Planctomycetes bacterium]|nr:hypothetical protein [Planctomycetota bacterium]
MMTIPRIICVIALGGMGWRVPKKFEVLFNDLPVVRDRVPPTQLPPSWKPPDRTPGLQGSEGISYRLNREQSGRSAFTLIVPPGPQILKVRYPADPLKYWGSEPTVKWQFAYVLTPARSWTVFGGLNVTIHVPEDWNVACSPEMTREGSVFKGSFVKPPADAIALTLQAPKGDYDQFAASAGALWYSTIVGAAILCWWGGRIRGRANARIEKETGRKRNVWPAALGLSLFAGIMVFSMGILAEFGPRQTLPRSQANFSQYDINWTRNKAILVTIIVVPIAFTICQYMAVNIHREAIDEWNWKKRPGRI